MDRLRTVASVIADNEQLTVGAADFKPAAPHPLEGPRAGGGTIDSPADEPPSGG